MRIFLFLSLFLFSTVGQAQEFPFAAPFQVKEGVVYDAEGKKVKLWGVNYLVPFNHNYLNIEQSGMYHSACIDKDIRHFKQMNIDFIRVHLYDREITDARGNLIPNKHLKIFDYLVDQAYQNGIFLALTPTVWWNTVENEAILHRRYAYWDLTQHPQFGFSNYFAKDAILWHPEAIACQKNYLKQLFNHQNAYSGKKLCEYPNIVLLELTNEPQYISRGRIDHEPVMGSDVWKDGAKPQYLRKMYDEFSKNFPKGTADKEIFTKFRGEILRRYFQELFPIVEECFGKRVLKSHIDYSFPDPEIGKAFEDGGVDMVNVVAYWNATGQFDGGNTDWANFLGHASGWLKSHQNKNYFGRPTWVYEFGASSSLDGYVLGAFATVFRRTNQQMAAFFTYTPSAVAEYNPGWLIHYLNMEHTPNKAAAMAVAGEIFRQEIPQESLTCGNDEWVGENFRIARQGSLVEFYNGSVFRYSASTQRPIPEPKQLEIISGRGHSAVVECHGNGSYYLQKINEKEWQLSLYANQKYLRDPTGSKTFQHMANRYMDIDDMPVVSRLLAEPVSFQLKIGNVIQCVPTDGNQKPVQQNAPGKWNLYPGDYRLTLE